MACGYIENCGHCLIDWTNEQKQITTSFEATCGQSDEQSAKCHALGQSLLKGVLATRIHRGNQGFWGFNSREANPVVRLFNMTRWRDED